MNTKRYALFDEYDGHQVSEVIELTDEQYNSARDSIRWKYGSSYYLWLYNDSYEIKSDELLSVLSEHSIFVQKEQREREARNLKRKMALYEKLKRELGE